MNLVELVKQTEELANHISFDNEILLFAEAIHKKPEIAMWWRNDYHYKCLAAITRLLNCQNVAEIGTMYGNSAIALLKGSKQVTCYDITFANLIDPIIKKLVHCITLVKEDSCITDIDYEIHDFIYIDIGSHDGILEPLIHNELNRTYKGIACYDDINWNTMRDFWDSIQNPKLSTDWRPPLGFGIVLYQ